MSIINQKYTKIIKNSLKNALNSQISFKQINNLIDFVDELDGFLLKIAKKTIKNTFESIDQTYKQSKHRKEHYYTKGKYTRTIMTLFGEIRFEREYYVSKESNADGFFYVDNLFSLPKRDYYDPMIKAYIIECSAEYSYDQTGDIVGKKIGKKFKSLIDSRLSKISRQTVYNIIKKADMDVLLEDVKENVETLYIQLDEKWVHTQGNNHHNKEIKAAVIYTDIEEEYKGRKRLVNRQVITSDQSANHLKQLVLDYITSTYNTDYLKNIVISGDGASWIKNTAEYVINKHIKVLFVLDRFHMHQAINHISKEPTIKHYLKDYLKCFQTKHFRQLCNALIAENPHRKDVIARNRDYIISNWRFIKHQNDPLFKGCSMEGHISHVLAAVFTARPKAHSLKMITKRLKIRELHVNHHDLKSVYLTNHVNPTPMNDYIDLFNDQPKTIQDIIGYKVTGTYKWYKQITHSTIFS
ncbi:MAG: UPF0236 family protein [Candidatus Izimaplasma sp.]|nr:UPF0236 family protein [Candidatus Izimaplasma bacterium]